MLLITCQTCKTALTVSNEKFRAAFVLATPYPGKPKPEVDRKVEGNVVQLHPDKSKN